MIDSHFLYISISLTVPILSVGEKRAQRLIEDRINTEAADREMRLKIEQNTAATQQLHTNGTVTTQQEQQK